MTSNTKKAIAVAGTIAVMGSGLALRDNTVQAPTEPTLTYFAELDQNDVVLRVIVADQEFIDSGAVGDPSQWVQTFLDGDKRKNYAGIGDRFDRKLDAFIAPKPSKDAVLDERSGKWLEQSNAKPQI